MLFNKKYDDTIFINNLLCEGTSITFINYQLAALYYKNITLLITHDGFISLHTRFNSAHIVELSFLTTGREVIKLDRSNFIVTNNSIKLKRHVKVVNKGLFGVGKKKQKILINLGGNDNE